MYVLRHISIQFRKLLRLVLRRYDCDFSVWSFCPSRRWKSETSMVYGCSLCRPQFFPLFYWSVLLVSLVGVALSLRDLSKITPVCTPTMARDRQFHIFGEHILRKARLVGCSVSVSIWLMLLFGILTVCPNSMSPWIWISTLVLTGDWVLYGIEVVTKRPTTYRQGIWSLVMPTINLAMVRCVKEVFVMAINDRTESFLYII